MPSVGLALFLIAFYAIAVQLVASALLAWLGPLWVWRVILLAEAGFLSVLLAGLRRFEPRRIGLRPVGLIPGLLTILWLQAIAFTSDAAILWLTPAALVKDYLAMLRPEAPAEWAALAAVAVILAPVIEEILFRGLLLEGLRLQFGIRSAVIASTLLFALIHLNPIQVLAALPVGWVLAAYRAHGGSLYVPIAAHMLGNGLSFLGLIFPGTPWISAYWQPTATQGLSALLVAMILFGCFLRRHSIGSGKR